MFYPTPISDQEREVMEAGSAAGREELLARITKLKTEVERLRACNLEQKERLQQFVHAFDAGYAAAEALSHTGAVRALEEVVRIYRDDDEGSETDVPTAMFFAAYRGSPPLSQPHLLCLRDQMHQKEKIFEN